MLKPVDSAEITRKTMAYRDTFINNPKGEEVFADLMSEFYNDELIPDDKISLERKVGRRDVLVYINDKLRAVNWS